MVKKAYVKNVDYLDYHGDIDQSDLMSRKHKKVCTTLNYIEHIIVLVSTITGHISISKN